MSKPHINALWTEQEVERLKELLTEEITQYQIAERLGRSIKSVQTKIRRMNGKTKKPAPKKRKVINQNRPWTEAETAKLKTLIAQGRTYNQIAVQIKRTADAIQTQAIRAGITKTQVREEKEKRPMSARWEMPRGMERAYRHAVNLPWGTMGDYRP